MVTSPQVSWLFFKARAKRPYLVLTGRASNAEKRPTGRGPEGCVENGPAAALLVGYVPHHFCTAGRKPYRSVKWCGMRPLLPVRLLAPGRRPILNATPSPLYARRYTTESLLATGDTSPPEPGLRAVESMVVTFQVPTAPLSK